MGKNKGSFRVPDPLLAMEVEDGWRSDAKENLFMALIENNGAKRTKLVLEFAAREVLARLAHILRSTSKGGLEWPEHVDIRIVRQAVQGVISHIARELLVDIDGTAISSHADTLLYQDIHQYRKVA